MILLAELLIIIFYKLLNGTIKKKRIKIIENKLNKSLKSFNLFVIHLFFLCFFSFEFVKK